MMTIWLASLFGVFHTSPHVELRLAGVCPIQHVELASVLSWPDCLFSYKSEHEDKNGSDKTKQMMKSRGNTKKPAAILFAFSNICKGYRLSDIFAQQTHAALVPVSLCEMTIQAAATCRYGKVHPLMF